MFIQKFKFTVAVVAISSYFVVTTPLYPLLFVAPYKTKRLLNLIVSFYSRNLLKFLGTQIDIIDQRKEKDRSNLIVCNHMSYLDILVLSSILPSCFITSQELKETPVLGQICTLAGCLFVERRDKSNIFNEIKNIEVNLEKGLNVLFFPEAKSTNGDSVIPFKRSLYQSAANTNHPILPITLNYLKLNGEPLTSETRDIVCWYDEMNFVTHLWQLCAQNNLEVQLVIHDSILPMHFDHCTIKMRDHTYDLISQHYIGFKN